MKVKTHIALLSLISALAAQTTFAQNRALTHLPTKDCLVNVSPQPIQGTTFYFLFAEWLDERGKPKKDDPNGSMNLKFQSRELAESFKTSWVARIRIMNKICNGSVLLLAPQGKSLQAESPMNQDYETTVVAGEPGVGSAL